MAGSRKRIRAARNLAPRPRSTRFTILFKKSNASFQILSLIKKFFASANLYITNHARRLVLIASFLARPFELKEIFYLQKAVRISTRSSLAPSPAH